MEEEGKQAGGNIWYERQEADHNGIGCVQKWSLFIATSLFMLVKTNRCLAKVKFPAGWHVTCTGNHWVNEVTTLQYIDEIVLPHVCKTREELSLSPNHNCLAIFDRFKAQCTEST